MSRMLRSFVAAGALACAAQVNAAAGDRASVIEAYAAGTCLVAANRAVAVRLIETLPTAGGPASVAAPGDASSCAARLDGQDVMLVRGAIAQALFLRDFSGRENQPRDAAALAAFTLPVDGTSGGTPADDRYRWADCAVRNEAAGAVRLVRSAIGSADEGAAIATLQPAMSHCFAAGGQLSLTTGELRSLFAQSLYFNLFRYWTGQIESARR